LDQWEQSLLSFSVQTKLIVDESKPQEQPKTSRPTIRKMKAIPMTSDPLLQKEFGIPCHNPKTSQGSLLQYSSLRESAAQKVHGYICSRQLLCCVRAEMKTKSDQTY
jgi:hypothetical protein